MEKLYSNLKHKERKNLALEIPLKKPFTIAIDPSNKCNFRCKNCLHGYEKFHKKIKNEMMSIKTFYKIVDDIMAWKGEKIKNLRLYNGGGTFAQSRYYLDVTIFKRKRYC